jgi:histidinol-phosphate aminotransferase
MDIQDLVRKNILELVPYSAARYEFSGTEATLLDANENPYRGTYNRYPDPWQRKLKENLGRIKGVKSENIFMGNGADEAIDLLIRAFCEPGADTILVNDPTYSMYKVSAQINNNLTIKVPLNSDFSLNSQEVLDAVDTNTKLIFLCSPVNPSGNLLDKNSIIEILKSFHGLVIIDEAYIDFTKDEGFLPALSDYDNLVVVQTFSKAWALAGIRVGMAFANTEIISILNKIKPPYNVSGPAQELALEATHDYSQFDKMVEDILLQRDMLNEFLRNYSLCEKVYPTQANFILAKFKESKPIYEYLKKGAVIVRDRSFETHCENCLRITIGTEEEMESLINLFRNYEKEATVY